MVSGLKDESCTSELYWAIGPLSWLSSWLSLTLLELA